MSQMSESKSVQQSLYISKRDEGDGILYFTIEKLNVSFINGIRRTILTDIPTLVFKTFPHAENQANITTNTSRFNNEIIKQRLSCIPIHGITHDQPYDELEVIIDKSNDSHDIVLVTTEDFKIRNIKSDKMLSESIVRKIFPPDNITGDYIVLARLRPRISNEVPGETLQITAKMSLHTAKEDGGFNVASCCTYRNSPDKIKQDDALREYIASLPEEERTEMAETDWKNHNAHRIFKNDAFDFKLQTVGVFTNTDIIKKACQILNISLESLANTITLDNLSNIIQTVTMSTIPNAFDLKLENVDYTIGKVIEFLLHDKYYKNSKVLSYVGFRKNHPHDNYSILRIAFNEGGEEGVLYTKIVELMQDVSKMAIGIYTTIDAEISV